MHDIKRFAIGAFLRSLLLKEQMMISYKKNLVRDNTKSKWGCKASGGFKRKISGFKKTALVVDVSVVVAIAQANTHHPPPPKKKLKIGKIAVFFH